MIKFPYGMSDFRQIITEGYFYCDRTAAIPLLERGKTQLFIRPRRFGKSLALSMLENYYDIARKDAFDDIFGRLAIGRDPTPLRNSYFILRLDFSCVDPMGTPEDVKRSLYNHINVRLENFVLYYGDNGFDLSRMKVNPEDALSSIESLLGVTQSAGHPVFLLIDEYDNFANTIMMLPTLDSRERYESVVHDEGLLRTVFKVVKASTSGTGLDRVFITGVSPVVMSDITSGHNIAEDLFLEPEFWDLCGFREAARRCTILPSVFIFSSSSRSGANTRARCWMPIFPWMIRSWNMWPECPEAGNLFFPWWKKVVILLFRISRTDSG